MEPLNIDPNKSIVLEIYSKSNGEPETLTISELTYKDAKEYFDRMEPDTEFQFFRVWPDGSHKSFNF